MAFPSYGEESEISPDEEAFFESHIRPILVERCYECHDSGNKKLKGGLALNHPLGLREGGDSGPALIAGAPDGSLLIEAVRYANRDLQMPPNSPLSDEEVGHLEKWVKMGAPDPRPKDPSAKPASTTPTLEEGREFWSFRPRSSPALPSPSSESAHPIDRLIEKAISNKGLPLAPPADDANWLRRSTFDLTGLPPTPDEVNAFVSSSSPTKYSEEINRLLDSPQYGIRWGRHWLDVARYADSNGLDENLTFGNAWRYRDYVINSFNNDKPFNQFLIEQIAGDLLTNPNEETLTATGFLALGARVLAEQDKDKRDMDVIDEQIDTLGKAFLGMTLGCARCHDHKFDPILQSDYYSLAAIFKSSRNFAESNTGNISHWYEHSFVKDDDKEPLQEWDDRIAAAKKATTTFKNTTLVKLRGAARERAADYLVAATQITPENTLEEVAGVAVPLGLHPRILYHCRRHLEIHRNDPTFAHWHELNNAKSKGSREVLQAYYQSRFEEAEAYQKNKDKKAANGKAYPDDLLEFHQALYDNSGFLAVPAKPAHAFSREDYAEHLTLEEEARLLESSAPDHPAAMGIADAPEVITELPIHIRGSHLNLGESVPRAIPAVFDVSLPFPKTSSGRLELAHWMAAPDNPLTARVIVNRVWRWHFGKGLVETTENFGFLGDRPSHPELLDWLANWFLEHEWSIKKLNHLIMTSDVYRRSTVPASGAWTTADPENRLLSFFPVNRLDAEAIRDSILSVSGQLDPHLGGKMIPLRNHQMVFNHTSKDHTTYNSPRRSAYLPVVRNHLFDWLQLFDYPDPTMPTGSRSTTTIAPQALLLMNSPLAIESSKAFAAKLNELPGDTRDKVQRAWLQAYGRNPTSEEVASASLFVESHPSSQTGWELLCQSIFASNEFLYLQ